MVKTFAENSGSTCIIAGRIQMRKKPNEMMIFYICQNQPWRNILNRSSLMVRHPILSLMRLVFVKLKVKIRQLQENNFQNLIPTKHFLCLLDIPCSIKTIKIQKFVSKILFELKPCNCQTLHVGIFCYLFVLQLKADKTFERTNHRHGREIREEW